MAFEAQGLDQLMRFRRTLSCPLVAIGGITLDNVSSIMATKVNGIALIGAITKAPHPKKAIQTFLLAFVAHLRQS